MRLVKDKTLQQIEDKPSKPQAAYDGWLIPVKPVSGEELARSKGNMVPTWLVVNIDMVANVVNGFDNCYK